jgi:hypothetical protein
MWQFGTPIFFINLQFSGGWSWQRWPRCSQKRTASLQRKKNYQNANLVWRFYVYSRCIFKMFSCNSRSLLRYFERACQGFKGHWISEDQLTCLVIFLPILATPETRQEKPFFFTWQLSEKATSSPFFLPFDHFILKTEVEIRLMFSQGFHDAPKKVLTLAWGTEDSFQLRHARPVLISQLTKSTHTSS